MNIYEARQEIIHTLLAYNRKDSTGRYTYPRLQQRPLLLIGPPGIGKTAIVEQAARECGVGLVSYTITHHTRQSAIGLPRILEREYCGEHFSVTEYTLSEIIASVYKCMEKTGCREGILFVDEINCVSETLAPAMLSFLQNKTFGSHRIPEGWLIVAAGNPEGYNRSVRSFDIVTLDRVRRIEVEADLDVWMDYARERGVHGAVLSYLASSRSSFYRAERGEAKEDLHFVTARGWEDLSVLLREYEALGFPLGVAQTEQFIRHPQTAREFTAWYHLYRKYGMDYRIPDLLSGKLSEEEYEAAAALGRKAPLEERFLVCWLMLSVLNDDLRFFRTRENDYEQAMTFLDQIRERDLSVPHLLARRIEQDRRALEIRREQETPGTTEQETEERLIHRLEDWKELLRAEHLQEGEACLKRLGDELASEKRELDQEAGRIREAIERAFDLAGSAGWGEQEELILVSGLTADPAAQCFIEQYGSRAYLSHSSILFDLPEEV